jgi:hypothetical protein
MPCSCLRRFLALACVLFCTAAFAQSPARLSTTLPQSPAGKIDLAVGDVRVVQTGKQPRGAVVGDAVYEGDTLVTGKDSELHVTLQDTGFIALRPNTRLKIVSLKADGDSNDTGVFSLIVGSMRSITGWIGRYNPKSYQVRTPTATIGIRGTDHETRYIPPGSPDGEPGTYDKVFAGETSIQTQAGLANVSPDHAGYVSNTTGQVPQVLPRIPAFFRPGPHEDLINSKHAEIQKMIEQRREERRKIVAEKQAALAAARGELTAQSEQNKADAEKRAAAADKQLRDTDAQYAALRERQEALKKQQSEILEARQSIRQQLAKGMSRSLREQLNGSVRENADALRLQWLELGDRYKAANAKYLAENEARKAESEEQGWRTRARLAELAATGKALAEKQQALQLRRDAIQAKNTAGLERNGNLNDERKAVRDAGDALDTEQKNLFSAQNELFNTNVALTEARMRTGDEQRHRAAEQLAALMDREQALQVKQGAHEANVLAILEQAAKEQGQADTLRDPLQAVRDGTEAINQERLQLLNVRMALAKRNNEATDDRQREALAQLQEVKEKQHAMRDKTLDLQQEREAMQEEIRTLYEQEQKRYREELKADRQLNASQVARDWAGREP